MTGRKLLVIDDDPAIRDALLDALADERTEVRSAASAEEALRMLAPQTPDAILADVRMPGMDGLELLRLLREREPTIDVIIMTAHDDMPTVVTAMREGAFDFLAKPLDLHDLRGIIGRLFEDRRVRARTDAVDPDPAEYRLDHLIGRDPRMIEVFKTVGTLATNRTTALIRGESGTGKELIARAIHYNSPEAAKPFVPVNCTALPSGLLESELFGHVKGSFTGAVSDRRGRFAMAGAGTIFLDEIGDTSAEFQTKLLRVLEEQEFYPVGAETPEHTEARVIAATHRDLEDRVRDGRFRGDLYYRLRVVEIRLPPLRDRLGDLPLLAKHLIRRASRSLERERPPVLSEEALHVLLGRDWPGNVRELDNCLTRAVLSARGDVIRPEHVTAGVHAEEVEGLSTLAEMERRHVTRVLAATGGHKTHAAEILEVSRPRLDRLIKKYEIETP